MITVIVRIKVKRAYLNQYRKLVPKLTKRFQQQPGCLDYTFSQHIHDPTEFVLYEQWKDQSELDSHYDLLVEMLGPAKPGERLPEELTKMFDSAKPYFYTVVQ